MDLIAYAPSSKVLTSTGTAVSTLLPLDQSSGYPKEVRITATAPCYVELGDIGVTAVAGDVLVQPKDPVVLATGGARSISVISVSGTASITVTAIESGSVQSALTSPSLSLDMLSGALSSYITFTRADATSCATYFDSTGRLQTAAANVARFDYDPATLLPRGLLIEESRTNLLLHSRDMTQAAWIKTDVTPTRNQVGIDGTANSACLITEGSAGTANAYQNGAAVTAGSTVVGSLVLKRGNTDWVRMRVAESSGTDGATAYFNLNTGVKGAVAAVGAGTNASSSITSLGGGLYRCTITVLPNGTYTIPQIFLASAAGDLNSTRVPNATYIVDAAQLEVGAFATSIITTTASTVTRAADSASMTGTNFSSWFNASAGTFVAEFDVASTVAVQPTFIARNVGNTDYIRSYTRSSTAGAQSFQVAKASVLLLNGASANVTTANTPTKMALAYSAADQSGVLSGGAMMTVGSAATTTIDATQLDIFAIGGVGSGTGNGHIRRLTYYQTRLPNATLQALTS